MKQLAVSFKKFANVRFANTKQSSGFLTAICGYTICAGRRLTLATTFVIASCYSPPCVSVFELRSYIAAIIERKLAATINIEERQRLCQ